MRVAILHRFLLYSTPWKLVQIQNAVSTQAYSIDYHIKWGQDMVSIIEIVFNWTLIWLLLRVVNVVSRNDVYGKCSKISNTSSC